MNFKVFAAAIAAASLIASQAGAQGFEQPEPRWYAALDFGYHWPGDINSQSTKPAPDGKPYDWQWHLSGGFAGMGRLGYRLTPNVRVEFEGGYHNIRLDSVQAPGGESNGVSVARPGEPYGLCTAVTAGGVCVPTSQAQGGYKFAATAMINAIYDIMPQHRFDPFVGIGVGIVHIGWLTTYQFSNVPGPITPSNPAVQTLKLAGSLDRINQFAAQFLTGVSYKVAPKLHLDLTYRYYFTPDRLNWNPLNNTSHGGNNLQTGDFRGRFEDQTATVGVRYAF